MYQLGGFPLSLWNVIQFTSVVPGSNRLFEVSVRSPVDVLMVAPVPEHSKSFRHHFVKRIVKLDLGTQRMILNVIESLAHLRLESESCSLKPHPIWRWENWIFRRHMASNKLTNGHNMKVENQYVEGEESTSVRLLPPHLALDKFEQREQAGPSSRVTPLIGQSTIDVLRLEAGHKSQQTFHANHEASIQIRLPRAAATTSHCCVSLVLKAASKSRESGLSLSHSSSFGGFRTACILTIDPSGR